jgi:hypothetical protein
MDITQTNLAAEVCAIHWQVAQGTSLENIYFIMSSDPASTQQGVSFVPPHRFVVLIWLDLYGKWFWWLDL